MPGPDVRFEAIAIRSLVIKNRIVTGPGIGKLTKGRIMVTESRKVVGDATEGVPVLRDKATYIIERRGKRVVTTDERGTELAIATSAPHSATRCLRTSCRREVLAQAFPLLATSNDPNPLGAGAGGRGVVARGTDSLQRAASTARKRVGGRPMSRSSVGSTVANSPSRLAR